ncbi:hypothetical protein [Methylobacterium goesingense]|uniref:DUF1828 domain-containing protein n=1 Tax=Methylobacterium goesingense TaxID=243690 RepID=A0ABV2L3G0_9HYPH|nr:hypothetical protein [Methylobacterium goesingense]GJD73112.1 hypothetical protein CFIICLFH_1337 [Methylobacterium goesingense]
MTSLLGLAVNPTIVTPRSISAIADEVARSLAYSRESAEAPAIVTPLLYPGGSRVVLTLREDSGSFFVTDGGHGAREADMMGGSRVFQRVARDLAEANDIRFDSDLIFDIEVPRDALLTAAIVVANASKTAVETTALRLANRKIEGRLDELLVRFDRQFGVEKVIRAPSIRGATEEWEVDAMIITSGRSALVDLVAANANSANSVLAKYFDISRLPEDEGFRRFAVLLDREKTPNLSVLGATSRLVEYDQAVQAIAA